MPTESSASPLAIGGRCTAPALATGDRHTCAVRAGGTVDCWGSNGYHQLGTATPSYVLVPTEVPGVTGAAAVSTGSSHTCALIDDGTVRCWGANAAGQLGSGRIERYGAPVAVANLTGITAISAGSQHTCALRNDGTVWCWGSNGSGRLGDGTTSRRPSPVRVAGLTNAVAVTAGGSHTCALTSSGAAYCWGANTTGQLGDGTTRAALRPVAVSPGTAWRSLRAGRGHTCGVRQDEGNAVLCWGRNSAGQLGDGTTATYRTRPTPVAIVGVDGSTVAVALTDGVQVTAGASHSCAVLGDGDAVCWGTNSSGQVGDGTTAIRRTATAVSAMAPLAGTFLLVDAGSSHTCAISLTGELYCWGYNALGALGDGTRTRRTRPTRVGAEVGRTFAGFGVEDTVAGVSGSSATSIVAAGDVLFAAGLEHGASTDAWVVRRSRDRGANWATVDRFEADVAEPRIARIAAGTLFVAGAVAREDGAAAWLVRRSMDGGDSWSEADTFELRAGVASVRQLATGSSGGAIYVVGSAEESGRARWLVRASADAGETWFLADDFTAPEGASEAHALLDTEGAGVFAVGHVVGSDGHAHLRLRHASDVVSSDRGTTWTDAPDYQYEAGYDTFGEGLARDLGGRIFVLARANSAHGWRFVLRVSTDDGASWRDASSFQLAADADTEGYGLLVDRSGTLHVLGRGARPGGAGHGLVASSYDHGATWVVSEELGSESALTGAVEDPTGALHAVGTIGTGHGASWTVRSRACLGLRPSCGNWVIDPGELCDGDCSDCNDHDACTTDVMSGSATSCDVVCTNTPITACVSGDGCCAPGCTSDQDLDCCTGPIENGVCRDLSFEVTELDTTGCRAVEHLQVTGTSRGGLAVPTSTVYYTGNGPSARGVTGRFSATDLGSGRATTYAWEQMFSDLRTGTVYVLGTGGFALSRSGGLASTLLPLTPAGTLTTPRITLSTPIRLGAARSFFSGYGRLLFHNGAHLYDIAIPSGRVTDLGSFVLPTHRSCANSGTWGVAESFGGALYIDYVAGSEVRRTRVPGGETSVLRSFTNLGDMCSIAVSPSKSRWYFHHSGSSQFAAGSEILGFCDARMRRPNAASVCGDGALEGAETCDGDCPTTCDDGDRCTADHQTGSPTTCTMACSHTPITTCANGDGCCVAGCNAAQDDDCASVCGNGVVEPGETCDGDCPSSCDDGDACTTDGAVGSAGACTSACTHQPVVACVNGDRCCPSGCTGDLDDDCAPVPVLTALSPPEVTAGSATRTITLNGTGLITGAVVSFDGNALATTHVSDTVLRVTLAAELLANVADHSVSVTTNGGTTNVLPFRVIYPAPALASIAPTSTPLGTGVTLTLDGSGFSAGTTASFDGSPLAVTLVSSTRLTAVLSGAAVSTPGNHPITVTNPAPGGGTSSGLTFTVNNPAPVISTLTPSSVVAGSTATTLTVDGDGFLSGALVSFDGAAISTTFVSSTRLTAAVPAASLAAAGVHTVAVANPAPAADGAPANFTVANPLPTLSTLSPSSTPAGAGVTVTLDGTGFNAASSVLFDGGAIATAYVSATRLTVDLSSAQLAVAGTHTLAVTNAAPAGGTSGSLNLTITNPTAVISSLSPASAIVGGATFTLTINGGSFMSGATATFNGTAVTTAFVSVSRLTASIPAARIASVGSYDVVVTNPAPSMASTPTAFAVTYPAPTLSSVTPNTVVRNGGPLTLGLAGTSFVNGAVAVFNGTNLTTTYVSSTQLSATLPNTLLGADGTYPIIVTNPSPAAGASGSVNFSVTAPAPGTTANPGTSCKQILAAAPGSASGTYWLVNSSGTQYQAYCEMTRDGGGWTAVYAAQNGSPNVFDHFDAGNYAGTCTNPSTRCIRRVPTSVAATRFEVAVSCGNAMVKFWAPTAVADYLTQGTQGYAWHLFQATSIGTTAVTTLPTSFYTGAGASLGWILSVGVGLTGSSVFASAYNGDSASLYNYCNGASNTTSQVRLYYREGTVATPLNTQASALTSCRAILGAGQSLGTGVYWIKPEEAPTAYQAYCDMTTDGGGWTGILAAGTGSWNQFDHFDSGMYTGVCTDPAARCVRRAPLSVLNTQAEVAVSVGNSMAKFPMTTAVGNYLTSGTWVGWSPIQAVRIGATAITNLPASFYTGSGASSPGLILGSVEGATGANVFASTYTGPTPELEDYALGVVDVSSMLRIFYRETPLSAPLNTSTSVFTSCRAILDAGQSSGSGLYWIRPRGNLVPYVAYCDMTTDGGGWTVIYAGRNGFANGFDHYDAGLYRGICTDPATRCLRRPPASLVETPADIAFIAGNAAVKTSLSPALSNYLLDGTQYSWTNVHVVNIGSATLAHVPDWLYLGSGTNSSGLFLVSGQTNGPNVFARTYNGEASYDYVNGVQDATTTVRIAYREVNPLVAKNSASGTLLPTCAAVLASGLSQGDGVYWLQSGVAGPYQAYCDMTHDGGGWTAFFAGRNGMANGFDHFDSVAYTGICTDPAGRCLRRLPSNIRSGTFELAASAGNAMVKFSATAPVADYFASGTQSSWQSISSTNIGGTAVPLLPDWFYAGSGTNSMGAILTSGQNWGTSVFASTYNGAPVYDYVNGVNDAESTVRFYYRESPAQVFSTFTYGNGSSATTPAWSCKTLHTNYPALTSGVYWLRQPGVAAYQTYCNMTQDGGGWTAIYSAANGSSNVFGYFDDGSYSPSCSSATNHCLRRAPQALLGAQAEIAVSCGNAMVKFPMPARVASYLTNGTKAGWVDVSATSIGTTGVSNMPNTFYTGSAPDAGWVMARNQSSGTSVFAGAYNFATAYDYCNGASDTTSVARIYYREMTALTPLNTETSPLASCKAILDAGQSQGSGIYWIRPDGQQTTYQAYCDMTLDGGGWTAIYASRNGAPGVLDYFDATAYRGTCLEPASLCLRRMPATIAGSGADVAVAVGNAAVKFPMTERVANYLAYGTQSAWGSISSVNIGTGTMTQLPNYFYAGAQPGIGFMLDYGTSPGATQFAGAYTSDANWNYGNGFYNVSSILRVFYRESARPTVRNVASAARASCKATLDAGLSAGSGYYWVRPLGTSVTDLAYCDMTTDGGGWTAVYASGNGQPNVIDHYDASMFGATCTDPAFRCMRRPPLAVQSGQVDLAVSAGTAMVKFPLTPVIATYLTSGTQGAWTAVQAQSIGAASVPSMPDSFYTGSSGTASPGFMLLAGGGAGPTFAGAYSVDANYDSVNGLPDVGSKVRMFYREAAPSPQPLNAITAAGPTCNDILLAGASAGDGIYWLQQSSSTAAYLAYCNMTRDGGGWTAILSARNGGPNVFATYDNNYAATCTAPDQRCLRRLPVPSSATYAAVSCGNAMVKFPLVPGVRDFLTSGTQASWVAVSASSIGTAAVTSMPTMFYTGTGGASSPGWVLARDGYTGSDTFAGAYTPSPGYDYCNGAYDLTSTTRIYFR